MPDHDLAVFENRLRKNARHFAKWAKRHGLTAYRIYDRDVPEFPYAVDSYAGKIHLVEYPRRRALADGTQDEERERVLASVATVLGIDPSAIHTKTHLPQPWGVRQYGREGEGSERLIVEENGLKFYVNLGDYLDTGLFMDHRNTRARVKAEAKGKEVLNLFAYTGAFSVYAAAGGALTTTSVDLSNTYCDWAIDNFELNGLWNGQQEVIRSDVLAWLEDATRDGLRFDLIVLDPPSFSASKKMRGSFNVQRDHVKLVRTVSELLKDDGTLYFSTNFIGFELREESFQRLDIEELTPASIPEDFHFKKIHRCWRMSPRH